MLYRILFIILLLCGEALSADTPRNLGNTESPVTARCVSVDGLSFEACGGGTQYTEGATDTTITGTAILWEDAADTLRAVSTAKPLPVQGTVTVTDGSGALNVICDSGCGGAASFEDNDPFTADTTPVNILGALYDTTPPAVTDGNAGAVRMNSSRALLVDGSGVTQPVSGTVTVTDGSGALNVIVDSSALPSGASTAALQDGIIKDGAGDTTQANVSSGRLHVDGSGVTQPISGTVTVTDGAGALNVIVDSMPSVTIGTFPDNEPFNVAQINGVTPLMGNGVTGTGSQRVTIASDNTAFTVNIGTFPDNEPINVAQINGVAPSMGNGASGTGVQRVTIANDSTGIVGTVPVTSGGLSISRTVSGASTNATNVKASAGQVYNIQVSSVNAAARYLHLYNSASAPTCNASIISTHIVPGNTAGAGTNIVLAPGVAFGTGIGFCLTTAVDGTGSVSANEHVVMISYK